MESLPSILFTLQLSLDNLLVILREEHVQLCALRINPLSLQRVSDDKSRFLATIVWHDEQRRLREKADRIAAPYPQHPELASSWSHIVKIVSESNEINEKNRMLLDRHIKTSRSFQEVIDKVGSNNRLYGSTGQTKGAAAGRAYNLSI